MSPLFEPPGPGCWSLDRTHLTGGTTPIVQWLWTTAIRRAYPGLCAKFGLPAETLSVEFVNGFMYTRLRPIISPDRPMKRPLPSIALKLISRLHPELRRRNAAAAETLASHPWREAAAEWHDETRHRTRCRNLQLQDIDPRSLGDDDLAAHVTAVQAHAVASYEEHFRLTVFSLAPLGLLVVAGDQWQIPADQLMTTLVGSSPSTTAPAAAMSEIGTELAGAGSDAQTLDEIRAGAPRVGARIDDYLRDHGARLYAGYDLDSPTLGESPDIALAAIRAYANRMPSNDGPGSLSRIRQQIPATDHERFDRLVDDARAAVDLRDDNGPLTIEWPTGLLRLALLAAGERLAASNRLLAADHIFELRPAEIEPFVAEGRGPMPDVLAKQAQIRAEQKLLDPPRRLGRREPAPPLAALPKPMAEMTATVMAILEQMGMSAEDHHAVGPMPLSGVGIGETAVGGRARVAADPVTALSQLTPGEILVTRTTSPAFNLVVALAGGLVTSEGGPMCHAAVLARELGIIAVVGVSDALKDIRSGDLVEVDPTAGAIRVLETATGRA